MNQGNNADDQQRKLPSFEDLPREGVLEFMARYFRVHNERVAKMVTEDRQAMGIVKDAYTAYVAGTANQRGKRKLAGQLEDRLRTLAEKRFSGENKGNY